MVALAAADLAAAQQKSSPPLPGDPRYATQFSPSMAIVIVVLIAAFFFLGFFSVYIRHCYGDRSGYSVNPLPAGNAARSRRQQRGLDKAVLETFPTMAYADVKEHKSVKGALECAVCLSEFDDDETLRLLPKCSHVFHPDCIDTWLASHVTCPVCRAVLDVPDDDPAAAPAGDDVSVEAAELSAPPVPAPPPQESPAAAVVIDVAEEETEEERIIREETDELTRIGSLKRALRSKSSRRAPFPRSHSTGHSLAAAGGTRAGTGAERFTLRLPEHVLKEVVAAGKLRRTKSLVAFPASRQLGSTRRGVLFRAGGGGDGSSRDGRSVRLGQSGRWPSFLSRTFSAAWGSRSTRRAAESDGSSKGGKAAGRSGECSEQSCGVGQRV